MTCGGTLSVLSRSHGRERAYFYGCLAHAKRGAVVCDNTLVLPIERVNRAVQATLTSDVLRPAVVRAIIDGVFKALQPKTVTANVGALRADLRALDTKIAHLTEAIESGAAVAPIVAKLQARQTERNDLLAVIGAADAVKQIAVNRQDVERRVLDQVKAWQTLLSGNVPDARQALREVLDGPIQFAPEGSSIGFPESTREKNDCGFGGTRFHLVWRPQQGEYGSGRATCPAKCARSATAERRPNLT